MLRIESSVTAVSWVPLDCVEGGQRLQFHLGAAQYDDPPPDHLDDLPALLAAGRVRLANQLRAFVEVDGGRIVATGQSGQGHVGAPRQAAGAGHVGFAAVALPDLRPDPEVGEGWARFVQTAGGLLSIGLELGGLRGATPPATVPDQAGAPSSPRLAAPAAWTTLALTISADGTSQPALTGASPFPRHWVYDHTGRLVATSGVVDFSGWQADAWDPFTPWGGRDAPARATAVETALERELSKVMLDAAPHWLRLRTGATLVEQGDPGQELFLLLDGLLAVEIDGRVVGELGPGAVVGELALVAGGRRTATLRALTPCRVAAVPGDRVDRAALAELARTRGWPGPDSPGDHPGGPSDPPDPPGDHPGGPPDALGGDDRA